MSDSDLKPTVRPGIRWWPAVAIVSLVGITEWMLYLQFVRREDTTLQQVSLLASGLLASALLLLWWLFLSRAGWRLRLGGLALLSAIVVGTIRFEGFGGDLTPQLSFRWSGGERSGGGPVGTAVEADPKNSFVDVYREYQVTERDCPGFRGAERDGIVTGHEYHAGWLKPALVWRVPVGEGWSGITVVGPLTWTQEQRGDQETVVCRVAATGQEVWLHADTVRFDEPMGGPGPRATPAYAKGRIYALGATGILNCLDAATGGVFWKVDILADSGARNLEWAMAGSPLLHDGLVIVSPGGRDGASLVAYDADTGERRWSGGDAVAAYSSPQLFELGGVPQVLSFNGQGVFGHDPRTGTVLWDHPWTAPTKINVAQPVRVDTGTVFLSTGYTKGSILLDVAARDGRWTAEERWRSPRLKAKFNNFVLRAGHIYGLDEGILTCLEVQSGRRAWKNGRYGFGQLLLVGDILMIQAESGDVVYVRADPSGHAELGRFKALDSKTWNHPTIANGRLFVRNDREAACFQLDAITATGLALE